MKHSVYIPLVIKLEVSPNVAIFIAFFLSGVLHEVIISVPFGTFKLWAFGAMMAQMPLCLITRYLFVKTQFGNVIFWVCIMLGQPFAVLFYYYDYVNRNGGQLHQA